jgi:hypothetical protein
MPCHLALCVLLALLGAPGPRGAQRSGFELLILDDKSYVLSLGSEAEQALPVVRSADVRRPLFVVRGPDVETYVWKTQRVTLTRAASARLAAALVAAESHEADWRIRAVSEEPARGLDGRLFQVRLDGEYLYGGVFVDTWSAMARSYPVIHAEWVQGRAIFYLLPAQMNALTPGELEESVGASRNFLRFIYRLDQLPPAEPGKDPNAVDPAVVRFRPILRDPEVKALFAGLGKLVQEPPGPQTPEEIKVALTQTDYEVNTCFLRGRAEVAVILKDSYVLRYPKVEEDPRRFVSPHDESYDRKRVLDSMSAGTWKLKLYKVLASEPPVFTGGHTAIIRSLIAMRGMVDSPPREIDEIVISTRRYEFNSPAWQLAEEELQRCAQYPAVFEDAEYINFDRNHEHCCACWPPKGARPKSVAASHSP